MPLWSKDVPEVVFHLTESCILRAGAQIVRSVRAWPAVEALFVVNCLFQIHPQPCFHVHGEYCFRTADGRVQERRHAFICRLLERAPFAHLQDNYNFDAEMIVIAHLLDMECAQIPIPTRYDDEVSSLDPIP